MRGQEQPKIHRAMKPTGGFVRCGTPRRGACEVSSQDETSGGDSGDVRVTCRMHTGPLEAKRRRRVRAKRTTGVIDESVGIARPVKQPVEPFAPATSQRATFLWTGGA